MQPWRTCHRTRPRNLAGMRSVRVSLTRAVKLRSHKARSSHKEIATARGRASCPACRSVRMVLTRAVKLRRCRVRSSRGETATARGSASCRACATCTTCTCAVSACHPRRRRRLRSMRVRGMRAERCCACALVPACPESSSAWWGWRALRRVRYQGFCWCCRQLLGDGDGDCIHCTMLFLSLLRSVNLAFRPGSADRG